MKTIILLSTLLVGCSSAPTPAEVETPWAYQNQSNVVYLVWNGALEMTAPAPRITWVAGEKCGESEWPAIKLAGGTCAAGLYDNATGEVTLVMASTWNATALVHELTHAANAIRYNDADDAHNHYPASWALVPDINDLVASEPM